MNGTGLYKIIQEAKSQDKAVQLLTPKDYDYDFIIEPEAKISFDEGDLFRVGKLGLDLNFIMGAIIIDNHSERLKKEWLVKKELEEKKIK